MKIKVRGLFLIVAVIYALCVLADSVTTILCMNLNPYVTVIETHSWGYPNCLIANVLYVLPFLTVGLVFLKIKSEKLQTPILLLSLFLTGILARLILSTLAAVANNIGIINVYGR